MYDELVKKLRYCGNAVSCLHCPYWAGCGGSKEDLMQAADAIEELQKEVAFEEALVECWKSHAEDCRMRFQKLVDARPKWISVEERLPRVKEDGFSEDVYVTDGTDIEKTQLMMAYDGMTGWGYTGIGKITHWCERIPLPEPPKEET